MQKNINMSRRKPVNYFGRIDNRLINPYPDMMGRMATRQELINKIDAIRSAAIDDAFASYNAENFKKSIVEIPDATYVSSPQIPKNIKVVYKD